MNQSFVKPPLYSQLLNINDIDQDATLDDTYGPYGPRDNFRFGPRDVAASELAQKHPLQEALDSWHNIEPSLVELRAEQAFGAHMALRLRTERLIATSASKSRNELGIPSNILSTEVLTNTDECCDFTNFNFSS